MNGIANAARPSYPGSVLVTSFVLAFAPIGSSQAVVEAQASPAKDPRTRPLLIEDALLVIDDVSGPIQVVGDVDDDGISDLVIERGGKRQLWGPSPGRVELVSGADGGMLRTLSSLPKEAYRTLHTSARRRATWDARGDVNGDGVPDLVVGRWRDGSERRGVAVVISGADASTLWRMEGDEPLDGLGYSVAFVGDVDGDGHDDVALGAPQAKEEEQIIDHAAIASENLGGGEGNVVNLHGGESLRLWDWLNSGLDARTKRPGYVSVRSGADGSELVRFTGHGFGCRVVAADDYDGDTRPELLVTYAPESRRPVLMLSLTRGKEFTSIEHLGGPLGPLGDVDGDGAPELFQSEVGRWYDRHIRWVRVMTVSEQVPGQAQRGMRFGILTKLKTPDWASKHTAVSGVGDLDGDGYADVAIGEPNFNIPLPENREPGVVVPEISTASLATAVKIESTPRVSMQCESGTAWVYSGRTGEVIWGAFGEMGERAGLGHEVLAVPDRTGDGHPDLIVAGHTKAYLFPGPGPEPD
jgi:hypothetical protein